MIIYYFFAWHLTRFVTLIRVFDNNGVSITDQGQSCTYNTVWSQGITKLTTMKSITNVIHLTFREKILLPQFQFFFFTFFLKVKDMHVLFFRQINHVQGAENLCIHVSIRCILFIGSWPHENYTWDTDTTYTGSRYMKWHALLHVHPYMYVVMGAVSRFQTICCFWLFIPYLPALAWLVTFSRMETAASWGKKNFNSSTCALNHASIVPLNIHKIYWKTKKHHNFLYHRFGTNDVFWLISSHLMRAFKNLRITSKW